MMCPNLLNHCVSVIIDNEEKLKFTKYSGKKGNPKITKSYQHTIFTKLNIQWTNRISERKEIYKLREDSALNNFKQLTTNTTSLSSCFLQGQNIELSTNNWFKEINNILNKCFKKIRICEKPPKNTIEFQIYTRMILIKKLKEILSSAAEMLKPIVNREITVNEYLLADIVGAKTANVVFENSKNLENLKGELDINLMWKLKKKLFPNVKDPPSAVLDKKGNLICNKNGIMDRFQEEFSFRLRNRECDKNWENYIVLRENLCKLKLDFSKTAEYKEWNQKDLEKALKKLDNNKAKDPHGHINELYKNMGHDGKKSLLLMMNQIKRELIIPTKFDLSDITVLFKNKGSRQEVENWRGIFKLPIIRNILDRLIYNEEYNVVSSNMGPFQVGGQKGRNIRDHTIIIHAISNEARMRKMDIDLDFYDIKQCFDAIWLQEATNDLYESGITGRNLNLLYNGNTKTRMCVETSTGKTSRIKLEELVMQGSVPGGFICSNQLSKICNRLYNEHEVYMYMNTVPVPGLCMVDDLVTVTKCQDIKGIVTNVKVDEFVKTKKLECQTGSGKCQWVHIGTKNCKNRYYVNKKVTDQAEKYKYLGDIVSNDLELLYQGRVDKANGYRSSCISMVTETSLGHKMFDIAKILHSMIFLNGTLVNMETWPHFTEKRLEYFEKIEQHYFRTLLKAHSKTPIETLYLELGVIPFRFHLMKRRINYFHIILNRDKSEITRQVIEAQRNNLLQGDFFTQVNSDLEMLDLSEIIIKSLSKEKLKKLLQLKIEEKGFQYLINKSINHSKTKTEIYCDINGSNYFRDSRFTPDIARTIFKFRTRMVNVKNNFRNKYNQDLKCSLCELELCDQSHLFRCNKLREVWEVFPGKYEDLFCQDLNKLLAVGKTATKLVITRDILLEPED